MLDLGPATRTVADVVANVRDDQLNDRTPCDSYTVGDLLDHVNGLSYAFARAAQKDPVDGSGNGDGSRLPADWRESIPQRLNELAESWRDPAAWTGDTAAGGVDLDGNTAGQVATNEVVVHGWDLARATGQEYAMDEESVAAATAFVALFSGPGTEEMRGDGAFGPEVEPPADATPLERLIAMNGRDPRWAAS
ncbi:TIGR03086 family metal-binding protein [Nocardioides speluncae]|uniref:TIGR03086 family metal-binding protein n=1 Tax=Nocardioides speluncae TaxID=2670337 RepID=UPI000D68920C|nr:TIGR03086 family metal-binding protein [Nocardioides speluncae]